MAISNHERIGKALELMRNGLVYFIEREMKAVYGDKWESICKESIPPDWKNVKKSDKLYLDAHLILTVLWHQWNNVFKKTLGQTERTYVSELRDVRNRWAHQEAFSYDDTYRALDTIHRLLLAVSATEAEQVWKMGQETMRVRIDEMRRNETRKKSAAPIESVAMEGLKPWREIVTPHPDVATGRYQQAEFAANLEQVRAGQASSEYGDPKDFFSRTYLTVGLTDLLKDAILRLANKGGAPVIELQTNFGGGKTHSMIALYHLFSGIPANELSGIESLIRKSDIQKVPKAKRAVLVGFALNPGQPHTKRDGTIIHTLWGELAWQLGEKEGYALIAKNDNNGTSPDSRLLGELFTRYSPCLILIDEWVANIRQTYDKTDLPGGSFDANMTFAQAITEAARATPSTLLVASLPASDIEIGGEGGREALKRLQHTFGRMESAWRPASAEESFEIVRRRLFESITDPKDFAARDAIIKAFSDLYRKSSGEVPSECGELEYARVLEKAYPIHPELFLRLYEDWGSLERFQRTRGVLRLMAVIIAELWERNDTSLMIMPASVPMDAPQVQSEMTRYLEDNWRPVMEKDVDGPDALPLKLDRELPALGRYSATRRVSRTIFMGSAPLAGAKNPGLDDSRIKLGCVQPGETVATFGDALRRLTDQATFLYVDGKRYWYSTQPSVTRLAQDRAFQIDIDAVWEECKKRLRADRNRGEFAAVHAVPQSSADIPDEMEARLVVLPPEKPYSNKTSESEALITAQDIFNNRGNSPRLYRNMLVFLAADNSRLGELEQAIRQYLAWKSICEEHEKLNLDAFQSNQAKTKYEQAEDTVKSRINETYVWLLVGSQSDPGAEVEWHKTRLQGQEQPAVRASRKLINDEDFIIKYSAARLRMDLDKYLWKEVDHLGIKKLWEYYAMYPYLSRLKDSQVLLTAIQEGVSNMDLAGNFAYAEGWDEQSKKYMNLKARENCSVLMDSRSVLVKPEAAQIQIDAEKEKTEAPRGKPPEGGGGEGPGFEPPGNEPAEKLLRRFHGSVRLDFARMGRDAGQIAEEVIQHLSTLSGSELDITLEIQARIPGGVPENVIRIITENCNTLHFD